MENRTPLTVCHVAMLYTPYFSGHGIYLEQVFREFSARSIQNIVLTANFGGLSEEDILEGVLVHRVTMKKEWKKGYLIFTLKALPYLFRKRHEFHIIHLHGFWDLYGMFTVFSKIFGKKIFLHLVLFGGDDPLTVQTGYKFMSARFKLLSLMDGFVSISTPISNSYRMTNLPGKRLCQIPQGVDTNKFTPVTEQRKAELRSTLDVPASQKIVTFVGAIIERKGIDVLLDAWVRINAQLKDATLLLVGPDTFDAFEGPDVLRPLEDFVKRMKAKVNANHLDARFIGKSNTVSLYLKTSDVFVLPSRFEGFGNVVIEAMSCGIPVVVTEMGGLAQDLINDGKEGFIVRDKESLAEKLLYLLTHDQLRADMGRAARERALKRFDLKEICDKYIALYNGTLIK
jgi:glycosyltransferase involved in cell wall biosynthesis